MTEKELLEELKSLAGNPKTEEDLKKELLKLANNENFMKNLKSMGKVMTEKELNPRPFNPIRIGNNVFIDQASYESHESQEQDLKLKLQEQNNKKDI